MAILFLRLYIYYTALIMLCNYVIFIKLKFSLKVYESKKRIKKNIG